MLEEIKRAAGSSVLETHPHYRTAIGVLGVLLPVIVILWSLLHSEGIGTSISAYYYTDARDWFVGILWVIGVFLFFYEYTPQRPGQAKSESQPIRTGAADAWLGKIAGLSAVVVALVPTAPPPVLATAPARIGLWHGLAAATLFVCLTLFPLLLFSQSRRRPGLYRFFGWTMIALMLAVAGYAMAPEGFRSGLAPGRPILIAETLLIWVFGISWFVKGVELAHASPGAGAR